MPQDRSSKRLYFKPGSLASRRRFVLLSHAVMVRPRLPLALVFLSVAALAGCDSTDQEPRVVIEELVVGTGAEAYLGSVVEVHQDGWVAGGALFHSTAETNKPDTLVLNPERVVEGWVEGVVGMHEGGQRRITIPPELAYGSEAKQCDAGGANCMIPPGSTLVFEVHLLDVVGAGAGR